jgi:beta-N-acetylhexosaminidase
MTRLRPIWAVLLVMLVLSACSLAQPSAEPGATDAESPADSPTTPADPDTPLGWGPTAGEWATAQDLVADWTPEQLAGQVIVGRFHGTDPEIPAALVRDLHLGGVSVTTGNIVDEEQVRALTAAVAQAAVDDGREFPPVVGVDQEGGHVSHLRGIATEFPHFQSAGLAIEADPARGSEAVREAARTTGLELRDLGFTWVFAPVADVTIGSADPTIGARSPSTDPGFAAQAVEAAVEGYNAAGVVSTAKHFPGHGSATTDSHDELPEVTKTLDELRAGDLPPFEAAIDAQAPAVMLAHLDMTAIAPGVPSSMATEVYDLLRDDLGFEGVTVTDSLGMGGALGRPKPAVQALAAGADVLLMPVDTKVAHGLVTEAITSGEVSRERAEEAAARVVAVQLWQQRVAGQTPVPEDVRDLAAAASAELLDAAY